MIATRDFSDWLDGQLRARRLSQRQLAIRSGVSHSTISRIRNGSRTPSLDTANRLARALGHEPILVGEPPTPDPSARVEQALRSDPQLDAAGVDRVMRMYRALRGGRRPAAAMDDLPVIRRLHEGQARPRRVS